MGYKHEHDLLLKDRKTLSPRGGKDVANAAFKEPILDVKKAINRGSADPRAQAKFLTAVKQACLDFRSSLIPYRNS